MAGQQYYYKIVLLGDLGVGKTAIFNRIKSDRFVQAAGTEQGADQYTYTTNVGGDSLSATLWDTAGGERFRTLTNNFYRDSDGAMLVYSMEDSYTFENLKDWIEDASSHINPDTIEWALIGNKCELNSRDVDDKLVEARRKDLNATCYIVSAKTGHNVKEAFDAFIRIIHKKGKEASSGVRARKNTVAVDSAATTTSEQKKSCC